MHRTEGYRHEDNKFKDQATVITQDPLNAWQEEIANVIESSGTELYSAAADDWKQLGPAIADYVQNGRYYEEDTSGPVDDHVITFAGEAKRPVTFNATNDWVDDAGTPRAVNDIVVFVYEEGGKLPAELSYNTKYYVITISTDYFQISATMGGSLITFSDSGSGDNSYVYSHVIETGTTLSNNDKIAFAIKGGELPTGLNYTTAYYVVLVDTNQFQLSATVGGPPIAFTTNGTPPNSYYTSQAYVLKAIDIGLTDPSVPTNVPTKMIAGNYLWRVVTKGASIATTLQLPGLEAKSLVQMDGVSDPQFTELQSGMYINTRYFSAIDTHIILGTYYRHQGPDLTAKITNTQDVYWTYNYPSIAISPNLWEPIYFNRNNYNNIAGVFVASPTVVSGWGEVAKDIYISNVGKYIINVSIPWRLAAGAEEDHALRIWDVTNSKELLRGISCWGDQVGTLYGVIEVVNPLLIINVQRFTRDSTSYLVTNGGISKLLLTKTSIAAEINIQKIA
jgi:hypothetical protein